VRLLALEFAAAILGDGANVSAVRARPAPAAK
jgi:hypothetical protein